MNNIIKVFLISFSVEPNIKNDDSIFQDIETFDLEAFKYNFVNITAFRAVDSEYFRVNQLLKEMERSHMPGYNNSIINRTRILQAILSGRSLLILIIFILFSNSIERDNNDDSLFSDWAGPVLWSGARFRSWPPSSGPQLLSAIG